VIGRIRRPQEVEWDEVSACPKYVSLSSTGNFVNNVNIFRKVFIHSGADPSGLHGGEVAIILGL